MNSPKRILVIRLKAIGDVIFTLPAVNALREHFPAAKISFLTSRENAQLLQGFRAVDEVITLDRAALRSGNPLKMSAEFFGLLKKIRAGKFSLVVDFQGFGETAWLARLTGAPQRWGTVYGPGRAWAYTHGPRRDDGVHQAEWNLAVLAQAGLKITNVKNEFVVPASASVAAEKFLSSQNISATDSFFLFQPFTSTPQKNWPLENFLALARHWREHGKKIVFIGGPADSSALESARKENFCVAAGQSLLTSAALAARCDLMVCGDTGLGHLAVAAGRRVVMLMNNPRPGAPHPFRHRDWALFAPAPPDISGISVGQVMTAMTTALAQTPASSERVRQ